jgi:hypothetical protein
MVIIVCGIRKVGWCLKVAESVNTPSSDWIVSWAGAANSSLGSVEGGEARLQHWGEFRISSSLNTQKYWNSWFGERKT